MALHSYPKIFALGHAAVRDLQGDVLVVVQEKVDGSQFSFGIRAGVLECRSKGVAIDPAGSVPDIFAGAVETAVRLHVEGRLQEGATYRGEAIQRPRHNALTYGRVPTGNIVLFDIDLGQEAFVDAMLLSAWAARLGLEAAPLLYYGTLPGMPAPADLIPAQSFLGGPAEGVVIKAPGLFGVDKKTIMAKSVTAEFKEVHKQAWGEGDKKSVDVIELLGASLATEARWRKAMQRLAERGLLTGTPSDIGPILASAQEDVADEEGAAIGVRLFAHYRKAILRRSTSGLPEWYKSTVLGFVKATDGAPVSPDPMQAEPLPRAAGE